MYALSRALYCVQLDKFRAVQCAYDTARTTRHRTAVLSQPASQTLKCAAINSNTNQYNGNTVPLLLL